jgi:hypothetical protein
MGVKCPLGRAPSGQALAVPATPANAVDGPSGFDPSRCFAFGDETWPGLAKLVEECGEVVQVVGKLMMTHGSPAHWSGDLRAQLIEELGDLDAAIDFVAAHCLTPAEQEAVITRRISKTVKFVGWHEDFDADPPPLPGPLLDGRS